MTLQDFEKLVLDYEMAVYMQVVGIAAKRAVVMSAITSVVQERDDWKRTAEGEIKLSCDRLRGMCQRDARIAKLEKALREERARLIKRGCLAGWIDDALAPAQEGKT